MLPTAINATLNALSSLQTPGVSTSRSRALIFDPFLRIDNGWTCDWPGHAHNSTQRSFTGADRLYGCKTVHNCNWGICGFCWDAVKQGLDSANTTGPPPPTEITDMCIVQPFCTKSVNDGGNYCEIKEICREGSSLYLDINSLCNNSLGAMLDPVAEARVFVRSLEDVLEVVPVRLNTRSRDKFQLKGTLFFEVNVELLVDERVFTFRYGDTFSEQLICVPGAVPYSFVLAPQCSRGHLMVIDDFAEGGYAMGFICNKCRLMKKGERWLCRACKDDYCFDCECSVICRPCCPQGHEMKRHVRSAAETYAGVACTDCHHDVSDRFERYCCGDCSTYCFTCAYAADVREKVSRV
jgi:hypothetical protein